VQHATALTRLASVAHDAAVACSLVTLALSGVPSWQLHSQLLSCMHCNYYSCILQLNTTAAHNKHVQGTTPLACVQMAAAYPPPPNPTQQK
jgi:hypothetical protein